MTKIVIDPVTRIEGHMKLELDVENGTVASAHAVASLYRGFENIVLNRDPRDAAPILSAICGVCHSDHHIASVRAVENAAGMTTYSSDYSTETTSLPMNAVLARNTVVGADWAYSHAAHLLVLAGPDYGLYGLLDALSESLVVNSYSDLLRVVVIPAQAYMHQIITLWGGKAPHQRGSIPGGNPVRPTADVIEQTRSKIIQFRTILDIAAPVIWNYFTANAVALAALGPGPGNFLSVGGFADPTTASGTNAMPLLFPRGVVMGANSAPAAFDPTKITEDVTSSWYDQSSPLQLSNEPPPVPDMSNSSGYTWAKIPKYDGQYIESGPLARDIVAGIYPALGKVINSIVSDVPGLPLNPMGSVFDRNVSRAVELVALVGSANTTKNLQVLGKPLNLSLVDVLNALNLPQEGIMNKWLDAMQVGSPSYTSSYSNPSDAEGYGFWEAPRGSLTHWIKISGGKTSDYQVIAPTTWNVPPGGPMEAGLVGTPVGSTGTNEDFRQISYVVRSFDL
ncbi:MAG: nickel-dependent hydrogenase large subunit, partial [Nitrososphaerales archaeon]